MCSTSAIYTNLPPFYSPYLRIGLLKWPTGRLSELPFRTVFWRGPTEPVIARYGKSPAVLSRAWLVGDFFCMYSLLSMHLGKVLLLLSKTPIRIQDIQKTSIQYYVDVWRAAGLLYSWAATLPSVGGGILNPLLSIRTLWTCSLLTSLRRRRRLL